MEIIVNHSFIPSIGNGTICAKCHKDAISHTNEAVCECCPNIGPVELVFGGILMCKSCYKKELSLQNENRKPENQAARINQMNASLQKARDIDNSIQISSDIFNAKTVAILDLKKLIDDNETITNKPYALASELTERFTHLKNIIFEANKSVIDATNEQKAIQVYLNNLANQLRVEEREKLKIADINYKPPVVKPSTPKHIKTSSAKKLDKAELRKYAMELGVNEFTLQMLVVSKGITVEQAANMLRKSINEAKSESN